MISAPHDKDWKLVSLLVLARKSEQGVDVIG